jgi:MYXO-CTERM domain-containing protein
MRTLLVVAVASLLGAGTASGNGRAPLTNGIHFKPGDPHAMYVASTFGLLVSHDDGCTMNWVCEGNIGYGGVWDPKYAIATDGTIFATTYEGLRVSRDGGCSFTTATSELAVGAANRIAGIWIDALDIGPSGVVWVGTAESGQPNDVYASSDNGVTFTAAGLRSATIFWKSVRTAPTNLARAYISGYEVATPTAHVMRTDNMGSTWTASPLTGVQFGSTPIVRVIAVDPVNADIAYLISEGAKNSVGDRLYRSSDAGMTWTDVLDPDSTIKDVVVKGGIVFVTTLMASGSSPIGGPAFKSTDNGVTFTAMVDEPQLACLGTSPSGELIGCGTNWQPDYMAVTRSTDGAATFGKVWRFVELAGPLKCPSGTDEYTMCDQGQWEGLKAQFAATGPTCGANIVVDAPVAGGDPAPKSGGCCDSTPAPAGVMWLLIVVGYLVTRRRAPTGA